MRGRSGCPTGQEKNSVGATGESRSDFLQGKVGYRVAPSSDPASPAHLPPEGKALRCASLPVHETTPPSPPSRWAGRYGRKIQGRRPGRKKERTPCRDLKNQSRESRGENLSPLALFPPVSREKRGPRRVGALRGAAPRGTGKAPTTRRVRSTARPPSPSRVAVKRDRKRSIV